MFKVLKWAKTTQSQKELQDLLRQTECQQEELQDLLRQSERQREELQNLLLQSERQQRKLLGVKALVDAVWNSKVTLTIGNNDFDPFNHVYDVNVIIGNIRPLVYEGLGLSNPNITKGRRKME